METQNNAGRVIDGLFMIGIDEECERCAVASAGRFNDVRIKGLVGHRVFVLEIFARELGVLFEIVISAVGNAFELGPSERELVFHVGASGSIMREFLVAVLS